MNTQQLRPAISGEDGHKTAFSAACYIWRGTRDDAEAWQAWLAYNATCKPCWSEKEGRHKMDTAKDVVSAAGELGKHAKGKATSQQPAKKQGKKRHSIFDLVGVFAMPTSTPALPQNKPQDCPEPESKAQVVPDWVIFVAYADTTPCYIDLIFYGVDVMHLVTDPSRPISYDDIAHTRNDPIAYWLMTACAIREKRFGDSWAMRTVTDWLVFGACRDAELFEKLLPITAENPALFDSYLWVKLAIEQCQQYTGAGVLDWARAEFGDAVSIK